MSVGTCSLVNCCATAAGNGTNDVFFEDPSVLFISTHQKGMYPGTGKLTEVGKGDGEGASINLPLPGALP